MVARLVMYDENGNIIHDGPPKRATDRAIQRYNLPLDLRPADIIHWGTLIIVAVTFVVTTKERLTSFEKSISYLTKFAESSDNYHSAIAGARFQGGAPVDSAFNIKQYREILNRGSHE